MRRRVLPPTVVSQDLNEAYELVYEFNRKGVQLPGYARWMKGRDRQTGPQGVDPRVC